MCVCVRVCVCARVRVEGERENGRENDFKKLVHAIVKTRSQKSMESCLNYLRSGGRILSYLGDFSLTSSNDWKRPTHIKESDLLYTQTTMPISSRNTLTEILKTMFDPISEHPMAQSS